MGLAGGPHCIAMCGATCTSIPKGSGGKYISENTSIRLAGLLLSAATGWAIWMGLMHQVKIWCV